MSDREKKQNTDGQEYNSPEIVRLGDAQELTAGGEGTLADGNLQVPHWKDVTSCTSKGK